MADLLLQAASELFGAHGVRAVGVVELVERAGVTKPTLYRVFASKDNLAVAWLQAEEARLLQQLDQACDRHPQDPRAGLTAFFEETIAQCATLGARGGVATNAVLEFPDPTHPIRIAAAALKQRLLERFTLMARQLDLPEPAQVGDWLMMIYEGLYITSQVHREGDLGRSTRAAIERLLTAGLPSRGDLHQPV